MAGRAAYDTLVAEANDNNEGYLRSLRILGSVGEPINPDAWEWYHQHFGGGRCPAPPRWCRAPAPCPSPVDRAGPLDERRRRSRWQGLDCRGSMCCHA